MQTEQTKMEKNMKSIHCKQRTRTSRDRHYWVAVGLTSLLLTIGTSRFAVAAEVFDVIDHQVSGSGVETWRIDRPNVKQRQTDYRGIQFRPGDQITVQADG